MERYYGEFESVDDIKREFECDCDDIKDEEVIFATYDLECYEGGAFVLIERDGKLYECNASHCSCFDLQDQWDLEETNTLALKMRTFYEYSAEFKAVLDAYITKKSPFATIVNPTPCYYLDDNYVVNLVGLEPGLEPGVDY